MTAARPLTTPPTPTTYADAKAEADQLETLVRQNSVHLDATKAAYETACGPWNVKIEELNRQFEEATFTLRREKEQAEKEYWGLQRQVQPARQLAAHLAALETMPTTPDEFETWARNSGVYGKLDFSCRSFRAPKIRGSDTVVFAASDAGHYTGEGATYKVYGAFAGGKLVGWLRYDPPQHLGDSAFAAGQVNGQPFLREWDNHQTDGGQYAMSLGVPVQSVNWETAYTTRKVPAPVQQFVAALEGREYVYKQE